MRTVRLKWIGGEESEECLYNENNGLENAKIRLENGEPGLEDEFSRPENGKIGVDNVKIAMRRLHWRLRALLNTTIG